MTDTTADRDLARRYAGRASAAVAARQTAADHARAILSGYVTANATGCGDYTLAADVNEGSGIDPSVVLYVNDESVKRSVSVFLSASEARELAVRLLLAADQVPPF